MKIDLYTKIVLTVIAVALLLNVGQKLVNPMPVFANLQALSGILDINIHHSGIISDGKIFN